MFAAPPRPDGNLKKSEGNGYKKSERLGGSSSGQTGQPIQQIITEVGNSAAAAGADAKDGNCKKSEGNGYKKSGRL